MRMEPGAVTIAHDHAGMEEFLVLEGDLVDSDGTTFGPGDFVSYDAGTHHNSWTEARLPHRRLRVAPTRLRVKPSGPTADSEDDSRLGTDGNQPGQELREGAADDAALLISAGLESARADSVREDP